MAELGKTKHLQRGLVPYDEPTSFLKKIKVAFCHLLRGEFYQFTSKLINNVFPKSILDYHRFWILKTERVKPRKSLDDMRIGELSKLYLCELKKLQPKEGVYERRFDKGEICFGAFVRQELVHFLWVKLDGIARTDRESFEYKVPPNEIYVYDVFTQPNYRGQSIYGRTLYHIHKLYREASDTKIDTIGVIINYENLPSIIAHERNGFRKCALVRFIRVFSHKSCKEKKIC